MAENLPNALCVFFSRKAQSGEPVTDKEKMWLDTILKFSDSPNVENPVQPPIPKPPYHPEAVAGKYQSLYRARDSETGERVIKRDTKNLYPLTNNEPDLRPFIKTFRSDQSDPKELWTDISSQSKELSNNILSHSPNNQNPYPEHLVTKTANTILGILGEDVAERSTDISTVEYESITSDSKPFTTDVPFEVEARPKRTKTLPLDVINLVDDTSADLTCEVHVSPVFSFDVPSNLVDETPLKKSARQVIDSAIPQFLFDSS